MSFLLVVSPVHARGLHINKICFEILVCYKKILEFTRENCNISKTNKYARVCHYVLISIYILYKILLDERFNFV